MPARPLRDISLRLVVSGELNGKGSTPPRARAPGPSGGGTWGEQFDCTLQSAKRRWTATYSELSKLRGSTFKEHLAVVSASSSVIMMNIGMGLWCCCRWLFPRPATWIGTLHRILVATVKQNAQLMLELIDCLQKSLTTFSFYFYGTGVDKRQVHYLADGKRPTGLGKLDNARWKSRGENNSSTGRQQMPNTKRSLAPVPGALLGGFRWCYEWLCQQISVTWSETG